MFAGAAAGADELAPLPAGDETAGAAAATGTVSLGGAIDGGVTAGCCAVVGNRSDGGDAARRSRVVDAAVRVLGGGAARACSAIETG